jgi:hypothetical protein
MTVVDAIAPSRRARQVLGETLDAARAEERPHTARGLLVPRLRHPMDILELGCVPYMQGFGCVKAARTTKLSSQLTHC